MTETRIPWHKWGITGTREGWTDAQRNAFRGLVALARFASAYPNRPEFHHGCCEGVDCQAGREIRELSNGIKLVFHPPIKTEHEGEWQDMASDEVRPRKSHFARNRDIVDETGFLVVVPWQTEWQPKGGTWYTHDYAVKRGKPVLVIWPDGSMEFRGVWPGPL